MKNVFALLLFVVLMCAAGCDEQGGKAPKLLVPTAVPTPRVTTSPLPVVSPLGLPSPSPVSTPMISPSPQLPLTTVPVPSSEELSLLRVKVLDVSSAGERDPQEGCDALWHQALQTLFVLSACVEPWGTRDLEARGPAGIRTRLLERVKGESSNWDPIARYTIENPTALPAGDFATAGFLLRLQKEMLFGISTFSFWLVQENGEFGEQVYSYGSSLVRKESEQGNCFKRIGSQVCEASETVVLLPADKGRPGQLVVMRTPEGEQALGFLNRPLFDLRLAKEHGFASLPWIVSTPEVP
jgi:hypothetical protein